LSGPTSKTNCGKKKQRLHALCAGASMSEWQALLAQHNLIPQFFGREHATKQMAHEWSQAIWDANARAVRSDVKALLAREFVVPGWDSLTLETLGLAELPIRAWMPLNHLRTFSSVSLPM
jgi:hypothetical protein